MSRGGAERERIPRRPHTASTEPEAGLDLMKCEIVTSAKVNSQIPDGLSHLGAPKGCVCP